MGLCVLITLGSLGAAFGLSRKKSRAESRLIWLYGLVSAAIGPVLFLLWTVYNAIENYYGLDSVKALGINAGIILATAFVFAAVYHRIPALESWKKSSRGRS